jgi:PAS domain S-box-containing protein
LPSKTIDLVLDALAEPIFLTDADGVITVANTVARKRLGLEKFVGRALVDRVTELRLLMPDGSVLPADESPIRRVLQTGEPVLGFKFSFEVASGTRYFYVVNTVPLHESGRLVGTASVLHDVTEQTRLEQELQTAREAAEEANRLKDRFIAALSHELRAPLQPILGWTEVLRRRGQFDEVTARALEAIRRNIRQQVRLVDDLLDISRIVHRKLTLRYEAFDLSEHVRAAAEPFEELAALRRVSLTLDLPDQPLSMLGDGSRVQQIVANLLSNAVKFTPADGRVVVRLGQDEREAVLTVEDTGEGITADELPLVFEIFRQGTSPSPKGGLGLGLNLVKHLVELHGGRVSVFSEGLGRGTRFEVRLPLAVDTEPPAGPSRPRRLEGRSILVIEDDADTRDVLKVMLELEGAVVETVEAGEVGVRTAAELRPDVVLCDIGLPDIDGLDAARLIRNVAAGTRLIALTGYGRPEDIRGALEAGFDAHLTKPVNFEQLLNLLAG